MCTTTRRVALVLSLLLAACSGSRASKPPPSGPAGAAGAGPGAAPAAGDAAVAPPEKVATVEGITEYRLANGLRVLLFPDASQATVTVNITYFVGSRHEGYGEAGMAHLLEHMIFKGTPTHPNVMKLLEDRGASFNGSTWTDRTNYYETLPASRENLEFALALEADRMINCPISADELAKEFSVVRNEFEMGENSPLGVLMERMENVAFLWHNYGKSTIGNRSDIERVPAESLRAFYQRYYRPDNAMLVVAGRFDEAEALDLVARRFGPIPRPPSELRPTYTVEPQQDGERAVTLRRVGDVQVVGVLYHSVPGSHEEFPAAEAVVHALTSEPSGRLYKALVETKMATSVFGHTYGFAEPSTIQFYAQVPADKPLEPVRDRLIQIVEGLDEAPLTDAEINRFKNHKLKNVELAMTKSEAIAIELSEWAAMGDWRLLFIDRDRTEKLTAEQVRAYPGKYLKQSNRTLGMFVPTAAPDRAPVPDQPDVVAMVSGYQGRGAMAEGEAFEASVANVEARTQRYELPNGMKVALLPKKTRGNAVRLVMTVRFGSEKDLRGKTVAVSLIPEMLMRGTRKRSYQELKDELDNLKAQVSFGGGGMFGGGVGQATVVVTTTRDNLPAVIALMAEVFQQPAFPKDQFEIVKSEQITALEEQRSDPLGKGFNELTRSLSPYPKNDVRYVPTTEEQIEQVKKVKVSDLVAFHKRHWGASHAQATVVGDFDPEATRAALESGFGGWKSPRPFQRVASPYLANRAGEQVVNTPDKKMAVVAVAHNIQIRDDHPDYPALELAGYILASSTKSRLFDRLRQKEGLSYGVFGGIFADPIDDSGAFFAAAICAPENVARAMAFLMEEVERFVRDGVTAEELAESKRSYAAQFENQLARDEYLASALNSGLYLGRTLAFQEELNARIQQLTPEQVNAAIQKYIHVNRFSTLRAGDMAAAKAAK